MQLASRAAWLFATTTLLIAGAAAQKKTAFNFAVAPGASVSVLNEYGAVTVRPGPLDQVTILASAHSHKVEVDAVKNGNRVEVRTHILEHATADESRIDYSVEVPANATLTVRSANGPISLQHLAGDITVESEAAKVQVSDVSGGRVHIHTMNGPVALTNLTSCHLDVISVGGEVEMSSVDGPRVSVSTTNGNVEYRGNFGGAGEYDLTTHTGNIDVTMAPNSSVDLSARSVSGMVYDQFGLKTPAHPSFKISQGKSFAGTAGGGSSSVSLRSFSGRITVKKP